MNPSRQSPAFAAARRLVVAGLILTGLITLFYLVENWRGNRAWSNYRKNLEAAGERLRLSDYAAPEVPPEQNFAAAPLIAQLCYRSGDNSTDKLLRPYTRVSLGHSWSSGTPTDLVKCRNEVVGASPDSSAENALRDLAALWKPIEPQLDAMREAASRPHAQFTNGIGPFDNNLNFVAIRSLCSLMTVHAAAELSRGHADAAFADNLVVWRVADALKDQHTLVAAMIRNSVIGGMALQTFWEGWIEQKWSAAQLQQFAERFQSVDMLRSVDTAMRGGERAGVIALVEGASPSRMQEVFSFSVSADAPWTDQFGEWLISRAAIGCPSGWYSQNLVVYTRTLNQCLASYNVAQHRVYQDECDQAVRLVEEIAQRKTPFKYLASVAIPNITRAVEYIAKTQTQVEQARLVCALDQYRRAKGGYPAALDELAPLFVSSIPRDIVTGGPLSYSRTATSFTLGATAWKRADSALKKPQEGRWNWPTEGVNAGTEKLADSPGEKFEQQPLAQQ